MRRAPSPPQMCIRDSYYAEARGFFVERRKSCRTPISVTEVPKPTITLVAGPNITLPYMDSYSFEVKVSSGTVTATAGTVTYLGDNFWQVANVDTAQSVVDVTITTVSTCSKTIYIPRPDCCCPVYAAPTSGGNQTYNEGEIMPNLTATLNSGNILQWFNVSTGGTVLGTGSTFTPPTEPTVGTTNTYYVRCYQTMTGCYSPRIPISITKNLAVNNELNCENAESITSSKGAIIIKGYIGKEVTILTLNGSLVYQGTVNNAEQTIPVPSAGAYLVTINGQSVKVLVK